MIVKFEKVRVKALSVSSCDGTRRTTPQGAGVVGWGVVDGGEANHAGMKKNLKKD